MARADEDNGFKCRTWVQSNEDFTETIKGAARKTKDLNRKLKNKDYSFLHLGPP